MRLEKLADWVTPLRDGQDIYDDDVDWETEEAIRQGTEAALVGAEVARFTRKDGSTVWAGPENFRRGTCDCCREDSIQEVRRIEAFRVVDD